MKKSEQINELAEALSQFQAEVTDIKETAENTFLGNKYADLSDVLKTVRPLLAKHGLSVAQVPISPSQPGHCAIETVLMHKSGQWMSGPLEMPALPGKGMSVAQGMGSTITYCRRYALASMIGVTQTDDDGAGTKREEEIEMIDSVQVDTLKQLIEQTKTETAKFCQYYRVNSLKKIPLKKYENALKLLQDKLKKVAA